ncbi:MAG: cyclic nucleotide-binding domain-containing protein [Anaerolineae bacterium]|jgi:CRP-like cAMP-binding protein|nr:cyclic nucleotide-binding domain-containing protein [Anaerolineae bacterium]
MSDRFVLNHLRRLPLFSALPETYLAQIAEAVQVRRFERGEWVFQQGQRTQGLYYLVSGRAQLYQQIGAEVRQLGIIESNQYLNEAALYQEGQESATLQVIETAILLFLARERYHQTLIAYPALQSQLRLPEMPAARPLPPPIAPKLPESPQFRQQRTDEQVLLRTRRHGWSYLRQIWLAAFVALIMMIGGGVIEVMFLRLIVFGLTLLIPGGILLYAYIEWRNDDLVITNQRIIRTERRIFPPSEVVSEIPLQSIQAVNAEIPYYDLTARLFGYGDLDIRTAGKAGNIMLNFIPNPEAIQEIIFDHLEGRSHLTTVESPEAEGAPSMSESIGWLQMRYINADGHTVYRKHWSFWLRAVFTPLSLLIGLLIVLALSQAIPFFRDFGPILPVVCGVGVIIALLWLWWADTDWRNDCYVIGQDTISLIHRRPLRLVNEDDKILINRIDNVITEQSGIFQSLLQYGDVQILLVGDAGAKVFAGVPNPRRIQEEIAQRRAASQQLNAQLEDQRRREEIARYIATHGYPNPNFASPTPPSVSPNPTPTEARPPRIPRTRH